MRLVDLEPRWFAAGGSTRVGFSFDCPHCVGSGQRLGVAIHQDGLVNPHPDDLNHTHLELVWEMTGGESWDTLSLTPSVDASLAGHWHGFISGGEIR